MKGLSFVIYLMVILVVVVGATLFAGQYLFPPEENMTAPTYTLDESLALALEHAEDLLLYALYQSCSEEMDPSLTLGDVKDNMRAAIESKLNGLTFSGFLLNSRFIDFPQYSISLDASSTKIALTAIGGPLTYTENGIEGTAPTGSSFTAELETGCIGLHPEAMQLETALEPVIENAAKTEMREFPLMPVTRTINRDDIEPNWVPYQLCEQVLRGEKGKTYQQVTDVLEKAVKDRLNSELPNMGYSEYRLALEANVTVESYSRVNIPDNYADVTCLFGYTMSTKATVNVTEDREPYQLFGGNGSVSLPALTAELKMETYHTSEGMVDLAMLQMSGFYDVELISDLPERYYESWTLNLQRLEENLTATITRGLDTIHSTGKVDDAEILLGPLNTSFGNEGYEGLYLYLDGIMSFDGKSFSGTFNGTINATVWTYLNGTFTATKTS